MMSANYEAKDGAAAAAELPERIRQHLAHALQHLATSSDRSTEIEVLPFRQFTHTRTRMGMTITHAQGHTSENIKNVTHLKIEWRLLSELPPHVTCVIPRTLCLRIHLCPDLRRSKL
jgi:hypothetical protein